MPKILPSSTLNKGKKLPEQPLVRYQNSKSANKLKIIEAELARIQAELSAFKKANTITFFSHTPTPPDIPSVNKEQNTFQEKIFPSEVNSPWAIECEQLLNEFKQVGVDDNLEGIRNHTRLLNERFAIVHNNYAISIINGLIAPENKCSDSEKLKSLKKAKSLFSRSSNFYTSAALLKNKGKIVQCINIIRLSIKKLNAVVPANEKTPFRKKIVNNAPSYVTRFFCKNISLQEESISTDNQQNTQNNLTLFS